MTQSLGASLSVALPILLIMLLGFFLRKKLLSHDHMEGLSRLCADVLTPLMLFYNTYTADFSGGINPGLLIFAALCNAAVFAGAFLLARKLEPDGRRGAALAVSVGRPNFVIIAVLIASALSGEDNIGPVSMLAAFITPLMNALCILTLELMRAQKVKPLKVILSFAKNPLLISAVAGLILQALALKTPAVVLDVIRDLSRCAAPLSLIALGGLFRPSSVAGNKRSLIAGVAGRLLAVPAVFIPLSIALGFHGSELVGLVSMFIAPTALSVFNMAANMDADAELAGQFVIFTSMLSVITMFAWIFVLRFLGFV